MTDEQWDRERGSLRNIHLPGPHVCYPCELNTLGSRKSQHKVSSHILAFNNTKNDRDRLCVMATAEESGGVFTREALREHYDFLRKNNVKIVINGEEIDDDVDPMSVKQRMAIIGGCTQCLSLNHHDCPYYFCPNGVRMDRIDQLTGEGIEVTLLRSNELAWLDVQWIFGVQSLSLG